MEKEWHVRAQADRQLAQVSGGQSGRECAAERTQDGTGITAPAAQSSSRRNPLLEIQRDVGSLPCCREKGARCARGEISWAGGYSAIGSPHAQANSHATCSRRHGEAEAVVE